MTRHLTASGYALTECGLTSARQDELTSRLRHMNCKECRAALISKGVCPECGESALTWDVQPRNKTGVADGRLTLHDVETIFYLGCSFCSATLLAHVDPETVARYLTFTHWRP